MADNNGELYKMLKSYNPLRTQSFELESRKYFSEKVLDWHAYDGPQKYKENSIITDLSDKGGKNGGYIPLAMLTLAIENREIEEEDIKRLCEIVNTIADAGDIEDHAMAPMFGMQINSGWLLCFLTYSELTMKELNKRYGFLFKTEADGFSDHG